VTDEVNLEESPITEVFGLMTIGSTAGDAGDWEQIVLFIEASSGFRAGETG